MPLQAPKSLHTCMHSMLQALLELITAPVRKGVPQQAPKSLHKCLHSMLQASLELITAPERVFLTSFAIILH